MTTTNNPPKVAAVGAGYWGRNLVRDFHALGALKIVCDSNPAVRAEISASYPGVIAVDSLDKALEDPEISAAIIASPAPAHADLAIQALEAGRDVLVEKPLALSLADGLAIVEAAERNKRILMVDHLLNRHPAFVELKRLVNQGHLGQIRRIWSRRLNFGKIRKDENVLWSFAPHDVAMILSLTGRSPSRVHCSGAGFVTPNVHDFVEGFLDFGPASAHLSVSWLNPFKEQRLAVIGSERTALFDDVAPWGDKLTVYDGRIDVTAGGPVAVKDDKPEKIALTSRQPLLEQCQAFLNCVKTRQAPADSDGREALEVMRTLLALDESLRTGEFQPLLPLESFTPKTASRPESTVSEPTMDRNFMIDLAAGPKKASWPSALAGEAVSEKNEAEQKDAQKKAAQKKADSGASSAETETIVSAKPQTFFVHPTAVIDSDVQIGEGTKIWHFAHVLSGSVVGSDVNVGQNVVIGPRVKIGRGCKIQNNVSVYEGVTLEEDVFCGPSMVFTNVHNPRAFISRMSELRPTLLKRGATVGANATIVCGNILGRYCFIAAGAVVAGHVPDYALMMGVPARQRGWICKCGRQLAEPGLKCLVCGQEYEIGPGGLIPLS
ncbi:MAG: Gfo/Idh/MocA family oxidoreductase [Deltaproteobacteria bacterium]|jgi:UDP-2-acetamido-3-amino-2,3-dideoxy-glucuronate N-acetyltransferase|nr:Gfo/Idh/MocA family oxidoreductase [Deltaproteobacteria bacterium]